MNLTSHELAVALDAAAVDGSCAYQAAVGLILEQGSWLYRYEFRQAVEAWLDFDGQLVATVDWAEIDIDGPTSSSALQVLEIARSLGGIPSARPLSELLRGLDDITLSAVLWAVTVAVLGSPS